MTNGNQHASGRFRLSQETIAIVTVGIALAGLIGVALADISDLRDEARADRAAAQATAQADRAAWQTESRHRRDEARADREEFQRQMDAQRKDFERRMEALQRQVVGLSREQARLAAVIDTTNTP